jgi:hypothetical protein
MIRTPDQRVRVFVSSTLEELAAERLTLAHAEPWLESSRCQGQPQETAITATGPSRFRSCISWLPVITTFAANVGR